MPYRMQRAKMKKSSMSVGVVEKRGAPGAAVAEPLCQPSEFLHPAVQ